MIELRSTLMASSQPESTALGVDRAEDESLPGRLSAALMALVSLIGLIVFGSLVGIPHMERHLRDDIARHAFRGEVGVGVAMDGRTAVLTGTVSSDDARRALIDRVSSRWGVARVDAVGVRVKGRAAARDGETRALAGDDDRSRTVGSVRAANAPESAEVARPNVSAPSTAVTTTPVTVTTVVIDPQTIERLRVDLAAIRRASPIVFARSSPTILASAEVSLDRIAAALVATPVPIRVEAHTDASGDPQRNLVLSSDRAEAVRAALMSRGVNPSLITAVGRGESNPIASNISNAGRTRNRRVEFIVVDQNAATERSASSAVGN